MTLTSKQIAKTPTVNLESMLDTGLDGRMHVLEQDTVWEIEAELDRRYDGMDTFAHDDTPSLGDSGQHLGSYTS